MASAVTPQIDRYGPCGVSKPPSLEEASAYCRRLARTHYENFTVASWLLPRELQQHFANVYAYCRWSDDLADEAGDPDASLELLTWWEHSLQECYAGRAEHPVFVALTETIGKYEIPIELFADLLVAFRQDQRVARYETFDEVLQYCRYSANPVGRLVLHLGRCCNERTQPLSDSICTGLQLINFCQDVARDWKERQRVYLPHETLHRFGCGDDEVAESTARGFASESLRSAIAHEVQRAETYLHNGWPLIKLVSPEIRIDVELFLRGGLAVAQAIRRQSYDVIAHRPTIGRWTKLRLITQAASRKMFRL